jgi:hypothetical protein
MASIFDGQLQVHYGQAYVESADGQPIELDDCFRGQVNGLCGAASPGMLFLLTGLHTGPVSFTLDVLDTSPALDDAWEDIVEVSFMPTTPSVVVTEWGGQQLCSIPLAQTTYRVRYCAREMDRGKEVDTLVDEDPVDVYALIFWPADAAPDAIIKQTSGSAAYWHDWVKSLHG